MSNPQEFRTNFLQIEEKLKVPHRFWQKGAGYLFLGLGVIAIFLGFLGIKLVLEYKQREQAISKISKEMLFYANLDFGSKTRAGKGLEAWLNTNLDRQDSVDWLFSELGKRLDIGNRELLKGLFRDEISVIGIEVDKEPAIVILGKPSQTLEGERDSDELQLRIANSKLYHTLHNGYLIISSNKKAVEEVMVPHVDLVSSQGFIGDIFNKSFLKVYFGPRVKNSFWSQFLQVDSGIKGLNVQAESEKIVFEIDTEDRGEKLDLSSWLKYVNPNPRALVFLNNLANFSHNDQFSNLKTQWEKLYNFNFSQDILPLVTTQGLIFVEHLENQFDFKKQHYLLIIKNNHNLDEDSAEIRKIEEIAKTILSFQVPREQKTILPDNTEIIEIVANPAGFSFEVENLANIRLKSLKSEEANFEFVYTFFEGKILFSNSQDFLKEVIGQAQKYNSIQNSGFLNLIKDCFTQENLELSSSGLFYLNLDKDIYQNYGIEKIIGKDQKICVY